GLVRRLGHGVEYRDALHVMTGLARRDAGDHLRPVRAIAKRMERPLTPRDSLDEDLGRFVEEDRHVRPRPSSPEPSPPPSGPRPASWEPGRPVGAPPLPGCDAPLRHSSHRVEPRSAPAHPLATALPTSPAPPARRA